ncbi:DUF2577 domain-containing protein [Anaerophilus nitritogenes]|uniref:DUF2577 domain-containing protein n=1 Tax=Anaerophilus nitritogenes TaxID=2498136 RepID=UPI00101C13C2|nr:DUF2577 domain-containing protein [Anaerophilus nitritogenes]
MLNAIKQAAMDAIDASSPVKIHFGEVTSVSPLEVKVDQRFTLTSDFLVVPERLKRYVVSLEHAHKYSDETPSGTKSKTTGPELIPVLVIREGLKVGDKLIILSKQGGQEYFLYDKVVEL